ncbi:hypothetical protein [Aegicerativicinus sediminis]|uniref:hypothetical protein n=1 Tax=Aegicerativicinus sediminis TaxID=2893202 RepID=UPI001E4420CE|nr:hypothetical protein [Aegicerativicinus sediminis]
MENLPRKFGRYMITIKRSHGGKEEHIANFNQHGFTPVYTNLRADDRIIGWEYYI